MGGALDTICSDPSDYVFLTGTLPSSDTRAYRAMAVYASEMVECLHRYIRRTIRCEYWFYVWELQKRGALHIHYCAYVPDPVLRNKLIQSFKPKWQEILDIVGERANIDMWSRANGESWASNKGVLQAYAQEVRYSVAAYMAKYCGKGSGEEEVPKERQYYPARWWGASRKLSALVKELTQEAYSWHTNYRDARTQLELHREEVLRDTNRVHSYPHKAGPGATCISYHPEDKGNSIWQRLTMSQHPPHLYPNASSWILAIRDALQAYRPYLIALKKSDRKRLQPLLNMLEDSTYLDSLSRYTLHQSHLRTLLKCNAELSLNTLARYTKERTETVFVPPIWLHSRVAPLLKWNPHGWLSLESDFPVRLTDCWSVRETGTSSTE